MSILLIRGKYYEILSFTCNDDLVIAEIAKPDTDRDVVEITI